MFVRNGEALGSVNHTEFKASKKEPVKAAPVKAAPAKAVTEEEK